MAALCVTEVTSWGVLYYAFPVLAPVIADETGWTVAVITGAFSAALVVAALAGVPVGRVLDRYGPRVVMTSGSTLAVVAIAGAALAPTPSWFAAAWVLAGLAMAGVFYHPAFAAVTQWYQGTARIRALTTLTLAGGLASTIFAPATAALAGSLDWRQTYLVLAVMLGAITIPTHAAGLRGPWQVPPEWSGPVHSPGPASPGEAGTAPGSVRRIIVSRRFALLTAALALAAFATSAVVVNLVPLLIGRGAAPSFAAWMLGLGGVGQVFGRLWYGAFTRRTAPRDRTVLILFGAGVSTAGLGLIDGPIGLVVAAALLAGAFRGLATLIHATAVPDRWGPARYATLSAALTAPVSLAIAVAPWVSSLLVAPLGGYPALFALLAGLSFVAAALVGWSDALNRRTTRCVPEDGGLASPRLE